MDHSRYVGFPNDTDATLFQILSEAQQRWLRPLEICEILRNYQKFKLTPEPPHKPQSGSLFLFDRKALRYFRKDGHNWRKKKDGKTVREAHERLKAGSIEVLHCYYAHGEDNDNFQRRSYWMLDENEHIVLVHYREVKEGSRSGLRSPNSYPAEGSPSVGSSNVITGVSPQTSPLVSPRASSTSVDWNGQSYSPEIDENNSNVEYHGNEFDSKPLNGPNGVSAVMEGLGLQPSMSFSDINIYEHISAHPHKIDNGSSLGFIESGMDTTGMANEVDLLEMCEALKQKNMSENGHGDFLCPSHEINTTDIEASQRLRSLQSPGGFSMIKAQITGSLEVVNVPGYDMSHWDATTTALRNNTQNSFGANTSNDSLHSQPQFSHADVMQSHLGRVDKAVTDNREPSFMHPYSGVFKDFQADLLASQDTLDALKKYDSFGRWINEEIGVETGDLTFPLSNDTTYWASAAMEAPSIMQSMHDDSGFIPSRPQELHFRITDYSPSIGSSTSDTKVLVTGSFHDTIKDPSEQKWFCVFGDIEVSAELLQPGVLRCYSPPRPPGKVQFYVACNAKQPCSEIRVFEYVADSKALSVEGPARSSLSKRDILFQIRLARMLSQKSSSTKSDGISRTSFNSNTLPLFHELEQMEELLTETGDAVNVKEQLIQNLLKGKLELWLQDVILEGGKGAAVLDDNGLGVLHMGAALGYSWIIFPLLSAGVSINFRDSRGWTALHWAAHCGRETMVIALLTNGVDSGAKTDPTNAFPYGQTAADVAASEGHKGIAGYLAESMLTTHLQSMNLNSISNENKSTANGLEKAVFERMAVQPDMIGSEEQISLAALRKATQAAALIHNEFRLQSFKKKQESYELEEDEYGITNKEAQFIAAARKSNLSRSVYDADDVLSNSAAVRIQQKYRGYKGRREFLLFRQNVVKIQAHFRGHQVRKQYKKILWSVSIVEKAILRWRRRGRGLRGFELSKPREAPDDNGDDFLKAGRKQIEKGFEKALERVQSMAKYPEAREQYRRLMEGHQKSKGIGTFDGVDITNFSEENEMLTDFASQM